MKSLILNRDVRFLHNSHYQNSINFPQKLHSFVNGPNHNIWQLLWIQIENYWQCHSSFQLMSQLAQSNLSSQSSAPLKRNEHPVILLILTNILMQKYFWKHNKILDVGNFRIITETFKEMGNGWNKDQDILNRSLLYQSVCKYATLKWRAHF